MFIPLILRGKVSGSGAEYTGRGWETGVANKHRCYGCSKNAPSFLEQLKARNLMTEFVHKN